MAVKPKPDGYQSLMPYLCVASADEAIRFYTDVLGGKERFRMAGPGGTIVHAELDMGDSVLMLSDPFPDMGVEAPAGQGSVASSLMLYVDDVDAVHARALEAGAAEMRKPDDQFYGDRTATFRDPFGHQWTVATHVEDVPPEEMERRMAQMSG